MHNDFGNAVNEYFVREFRRLYKERKARINALKTPEAVLEYAGLAKKRIREIFDLEKLHRTPLNPQVTGSHAYKYYTKQNIVFESLPGYYVTANLYLPSDMTGPVPAVLHLCGHNQDAKSCTNGVSFNVGTAANGIAVFCFDPVCQGERFQHFMENENNLCGAHNTIGKELLLFGEHFPAWRAWDALRAVDLLCEMPEIDSSRIMLTGCSGGGTMTTWVNALEDRLIAAAPSCAVTLWRRTVENENPIDAEQLPPDLAGEGYDMADFLIASLPRPILVSGEINDFFDVRGQQEAGREMEMLSTIVKAPIKSTYFTGPHPHALQREQREAIRAFFFKAAGVTPRGICEDDVPRPATEEKLAAPDGDVFKLPGNRSALTIMKERCNAVISARKALSKAELAQVLKKCLALPADIPVPDDYRRLPLQIFREGSENIINRYLIENEERMLCVLNALTGTGDYQVPQCKEAVLYLPDVECIEMETLPEEFYKGKILFGIDTFGVGNMIPTSCGVSARKPGDFYGAYWHYAGLAVMLGKSFPGLQMEGILGALKLLKARGTEKVTLIGRGYGAILGAYTALLAEDMVEKTILLDAPCAFEELVGTYNTFSFAGILPNILRYADWLDIAKAVNAEFR